MSCTETVTLPIPLTLHLDLAPTPYETAQQAFVDPAAFVHAQGAQALLWCLQHTPVYTLGMSARRDHLHRTGDTPVVVTERGGSATWHGPGQLLLYPLLPLKALGLGMRDVIHSLESAAIDTARHWGRTAWAGRTTAPGVFAEEGKLASIGLRYRNGWTSHGMAINISNSLAHFEGIDPCGRPGQPMARLLPTSGDRLNAAPLGAIATHLMHAFARELAARCPAMAPSPPARTRPPVRVTVATEQPPATAGTGEP